MKQWEFIFHFQELFMLSVIFLFNHSLGNKFGTRRNKKIEHESTIGTVVYAI